MPVIYKEVKIDRAYRIDSVVEDKVVVRRKTVEFTDVHVARVLTCLRLCDYTPGRLTNFHATLLENGIKRVVN